MNIIYTHEVDKKFAIRQSVGTVHRELVAIGGHFRMLELLGERCNGITDIREGVSEVVQCRVTAIGQRFHDRSIATQNHHHQQDTHITPTHHHHILHLMKMLHLQQQPHGSNRLCHFRAQIPDEPRAYKLLSTA
jgi:hypothetical protein